MGGLRVSLPRSLPWLAAALLGCGEPAPPDDGANPDPSCHPLAPLGAPGSCALPYPSSFYLREERSTPTGLRVALREEALPRNRTGDAFDPSRLNLLDGFSPATQLLADLPARVDGRQLLPVDADPSPTLEQAAPVQLLEYESGERVPLFAELDANAVEPGAAPDERQALIIRPLQRLRPSTRYLVALRALRDTQGAPITVRPFQALVEGGAAVGPRLAGLRARYEEIFARLERSGVPRRELTLAWDFTTGSDARIQGNLLSMRDAALRRLPQDGGLAIRKVEEATNDPQVLRRIEGTFAVPSFLTDAQAVDAGLALDEAGRPMDTGRDLSADLVIYVPRCAERATQPLRIVIYGHGLLGEASEISSPLHRRIAQELCIIEAATSFVGLSSADIGTLTTKALPRFDRLSIITDRLQQAQVNFLVLAHLARTRLPALPELTAEGLDGGRPLSDGKQVYYLGASQGGIFGNTIVALSPDLDRGVLNVGGGNYSMMLPRSTHFRLFQQVISAAYPDLVSQQLLLALSQGLWDPSDPISFARRSVGSPLPGPDGRPLPPKRILLQESRGDCQVPNLATRTVARTMGLTQLLPDVEPVFGLQQGVGPLDSAYVQYDTAATPPPSRTNVPGAKDNGAHGALGDIAAVVEQIDAFLRPGGRVKNACGKSCVFPRK